MPGAPDDVDPGIQPRRPHHVRARSRRGRGVLRRARRALHRLASARDGLAPAGTRGARLHVRLRLDEVRARDKLARALPVDTTLHVEKTDDPAAFDRVAAEGFDLPSELRRASPPSSVDQAGTASSPGVERNPPRAGRSSSTAGLGVGATRPGFRRRGGQNALLAERIGRARELGVELVTTETASASWTARRGRTATSAAPAFPRGVLPSELARAAVTSTLTL